jgi:hypothetical protein
MFSAPFLSTLLDRVKAIVRRVARPRAELVRTSPVEARVAVSPVLRGIARDWLSAKLRALSALMRRVEAGEPVEMPASAALAGKVADAAGECLPRGFGWMCAIDPHAPEAGAAFVHWLNEPEVRAKVMAAPEEMARVIGPILYAVGAALPDWLAVVPEGGKTVPSPCELGHGLLPDAENPMSAIRESGSDLDGPSRPLREVGDAAGDRRIKPGDGDFLSATIVSGAIALPATERGNALDPQQFPLARNPPRNVARRSEPLTRAFSRIRRTWPAENVRPNRFDIEISLRLSRRTSAHPLAKTGPCRLTPRPSPGA